MKNYFLTLIFIAALAPNLPAQNPLVKQWDKRFGGTLADEFYSLQQTTDSGYILGGISYSGISGDKTQPSWGSTDYWVVKIDSLGIKQWDKRFGGSYGDYFYSLKQTKDGGYILGGDSYSGISGDKTQPSWGGWDYWIVKIDPMGFKQWDKRFGGNDDDWLFSLQQTFDGGYILGGYTYSGLSGDKTQPAWGGPDYWIVKIDSLGIKQWDKRFGGIDADFLYSLQQTTDGGYILGGCSWSGISGDKTQLSWGNSWDYWVVKIDSLGIKQWDKRFGGMASDDLTSLKQTTDGGYILGGNSTSGIGGDKTQPSWGWTDYWIVKIDSLGTKQWDKQFGGTDIEEFYSVSETIDKGYLISGDSYSPISGDKTENNLGPEQTWVLKTDSLGNKQWDKTIFTTGHDEIGIAIQTKDGCYAMANGTSAGIGGSKTQGSQGLSDYWIIKFCDATSAFIPSINLSSSDTSFCEKNCIDFTDLSTNNPTSWQWFFPGADTATSSLQNPTNICYSTYGSFDVTLIACNAAGCDTLVLHNFINEFQNPTDSIYQSNDTLYSLPAYSYQWYETASGLIAGATNPFYVFTQPGSYYCLVTDSVGCEASSNVVVITGFNQSAIFNSQLAIVPNPNDGKFEIALSNQLPFANCQLRITNVMGQTVFTQHPTPDTQPLKLDLSYLPTGIYSVSITTSNGIITKRFEVLH